MSCTDDSVVFPTAVGVQAAKYLLKYISKGHVHAPCKVFVRPRTPRSVADGKRTRTPRTPRAPLRRSAAQHGALRPRYHGVQP